MDSSARQAPLRPTPKSQAASSRAVETADACAQTEASPEGPAEPRAKEPVEFHTGPAMKIALEQRFRGAEGSIAGALYCIDDAELVRALSLKARDGVQVRLVLDEGQVRKPSCSMQLQRMLELIEWGASVYRLRVGTGFALLHHKLWGRRRRDAPQRVSESNAPRLDVQRRALARDQARGSRERCLGPH